jgi:uncharacterized protein (TIRG00374 family)
MTPMPDEESSAPRTSLDPRRLRTGLLIAVGIGLTVGLGVALLADGPAVLAGIEKLPLVWLLVALALSVASWFGQGIGFAALTERGVRGNVLRMTRAFLGGDFPALVSPFGSGGIPGGIFCLTREGISTGEASAIITMHSLLTGVFFIIVGAAGAILLPIKSAGSSALVWSGFVAILAGVGAIVWVALRPHRATALLHRLLDSGVVRRVLGPKRSERALAAAEREAMQFAASVRLLLRERPGSLALSFAGLFVSRVFLMIALPVIMYGLGWRGDVFPLLATAVGAMALAVASPTPGGSGAVEATLTALLATQTSVPVAAAAALLWRGITYYTELLAGWAAFSRYLAKGRAPAL